MMTTEEILQLVKEHFIEEGVDEDGYCWTEYAGKPDAFLKFAQAIYDTGYSRGYDDGYL
jgi:hypothetical protein